MSCSWNALSPKSSSRLSFKTFSARFRQIVTSLRLKLSESMTLWRRSGRDSSTNFVFWKTSLRQRSTQWETITELNSRMLKSVLINLKTQSLKKSTTELLKQMNRSTKPKTLWIVSPLLSQVLLTEQYLLYRSSKPVWRWGADAHWTRERHHARSRQQQVQPLKEDWQRANRQGSQAGSLQGQHQFVTEEATQVYRRVPKGSNGGVHAPERAPREWNGWPFRFLGWDHRQFVAEHQDIPGHDEDCWRNCLLRPSL